MIAYLGNALQILEIVLGVGFIIFAHESGHFLMAKKNGVRVDVFSLGFGAVLASWRKGMGFRAGSTVDEYEAMQRRHREMLQTETAGIQREDPHAFGEKLKALGQTEYRISLIPLGGFVKMAGENPGEEKSGAADELGQKSGWQRFQIFVAGAAMNFLIAFPIIASAFVLGLYEPGLEVGLPGRAEAEAGIRAGDVIRAVDGRPVRSIDVYRRELIRAPMGTSIAVTVLRDGAEATYPVTASGSKGHEILPRFNVVSDLLPGGPAEKGGMKPGDEILEADGAAVYTREDLARAIRAAGGRPLALKVRRPDPGQPHARNSSGTETALAVTPETRPDVPEALLDALQEPQVGRVVEKAPADGALRVGDRVVAIDGKPLATWGDMKKTIQDGQEHAFGLRRGGEPVEARIRPVNEGGIWRIGIGPQSTGVFASVPEGTPFAAAGLRAGDEVVSVDGDPAANTVAKLVDRIIDPAPGARPLKVRVRREGKEEEVALDPGVFPKAGKDIGIAIDLQRIWLRYGPAEALRAAPGEVGDLFVLTIQLLKKLFTREESAAGLAGPVGIFQISYKAAERGPGNLLWLLSLITVNLAVVNVLPIPVLDGGHILFLAIEKMKGSPPSEKFIAAAQWSGLILLLTLIVFVTYHDLGRIFGFGG